MPGMAYVDVIFDSAGAAGFARAEIVARIDRARSRLPATARLQIGPLASSTGWVYQYALVNPVRRSSLLDMRQFQDNVLQPALAAIPGVAEVAALGRRGPAAERGGEPGSAARARARLHRRAVGGARARWPRGSSRRSRTRLADRGAGRHRRGRPLGSTTWPMRASPATCRAGSAIWAAPTGPSAES